MPTHRPLFPWIAPALLLSALALTQTAQAQSNPNAYPEEQRRQDERTQAQNQQLQKTREVTGPETVLKTTRLPQDEAPCFVIQQIDLQGDSRGNKDLQDTNALFDAVSNALSGPNGDDHPLRKCLGAQGVNLVLQRAQDALVAKGYVTSRVLAPSQNLADGTLTLAILPARISAIRFASNPAPNASDKAANAPANTPENAPTQLHNTLPMAVGSLLNLRDIEQGLENLKRVPTAEADIQIEPSASGAPDQSDLVVRYQASTPVRGSVSVDDSGSRTTGTYQGSATFSWDNPLGLSDLFYLTLNHDLINEFGRQLANTPSGPRGTRGRTLHYSLPLGYWLLGTTYSNSTYHQSVAGQNQDYIYSGDSENSELKLSRILYRNASDKTTASLKAWARTSHNYVDDTEVEVQRRNTGGWELGLGHKTAFGEASLDINLAYKLGTKDFGAQPAPEEYEQTDPDAGTSQFRLVTLDITYAQPFKVGAQALRYSANLRTQSNATALTAPDRFSIGGRYTVRGFDGESSLSAERGWLLRNDLSATLGDSAHALYLGLDAGEVSGASALGLLGNTLSGGVVGLRGSLKPCATAQGCDLQYDLFVGAPLYHPTGFKTATTTAGFSLNLTF